MYACVCYSSLFKCITKYRLYKQIENLNSTSVLKPTPGYGTGVYVINSVTILIASTDMFKYLNIRYRKT